MMAYARSVRPGPWLPVRLLAVVLVAAGCTGPQVVLGGSITLSRARAQGELGARSSLRSALWVALRCASHDDSRERAPVSLRDEAWLDDEPSAPCAVDAACVWQRQAARDAWLAQSSITQGGLLP